MSQFEALLEAAALGQRKQSKKGQLDLFGLMDSSNPSKAQSSQSKKKDEHQYLKLAEQKISKAAKDTSRIIAYSDLTHDQRKSKKNIEEAQRKLKEATNSKQKQKQPQKIYKPRIVDLFGTLKKQQNKAEQRPGEDKQSLSNQQGKGRRDAEEYRKADKQPKRPYDQSDKVVSRQKEEQRAKEKLMLKEKQKQKAKDKHQHQKDKQKYKNKYREQNQKYSQKEKGQRDRSKDKQHYRQERKKKKNRRSSQQSIEQDDDWLATLRKTTGYDPSARKFRERDMMFVQQATVNTMLKEEKASLMAGILEDRQDYLRELREAEKHKKSKRP